MGRKSKFHRSLIAIIVITENSQEIIELDKKERIKNLGDLSRLPKMKKKKYNRKICKISKTIKNCANIKDVPSMFIKEMSPLFSDKSFLEDFTVNGKNLADFDFGLEKLESINY